MDGNLDPSVKPKKKMSRTSKKKEVQIQISYSIFF